MKRSVFGLLTVLLATVLLNGCGGGGGSTPNPPPTGTDTTSPTVAAMTSATISQTQINLNWGAATDAGGLNTTTPYRLFSAQGATPPASCSGTPIYQGTGTSFNNTGLTAATQYSYRLCVFDAAGNSASTTSSATTTNPTTGSSAGSAVIATPKPITDSTQAAKAADASVTIATQIASSSGVTSLTSLVMKASSNTPESGRRVMDIVHSAMDKVNDTRTMKKSRAKVAPATTAPEPVPCPDGGDMTIDMPTGTQTSVTMTYNNCKDSNSQKNGVFSYIEAADGSFNMTMGGSPTSPYVETFYSGTTYTTITEKQQQYLKMSFSFTETATTMNLSMTMSGYDDWYDFANNRANKTEFSNFAFTATETKDATGAITSTDMTMNGSNKYSEYNGTTISATTLDTFEDTTFKNFKLIDTSNANGEQISISGTMAFLSQPDCMSGTYNFTTQVPISINASGSVTAGQITVNGVVIVFNADGSVTTTINGVPVNVPHFADACTL